MPRAKCMEPVVEDMNVMGFKEWGMLVKRRSACRLIVEEANAHPGR